MQNRISKLKKQMASCYSGHCAKYDLYCINRGLVHQVLTQLKSIESIDLSDSTHTDKNGSFFSVMPVLALLMMFFSACSPDSCQATKGKEGANVQRKIIAIAKDNSGSIDTFGATKMQVSLLNCLRDISSPEQEIMFYCTSVETNMGLNNMERYHYHLLPVATGQDMLSENERQMNDFLLDRMKRRQLDSLVFQISQRQFATIYRSGNTPLLEYLQLLSTIEDTCGIDVVIVSDLLQSSALSDVIGSDLSTRNKALARAAADLRKLRNVYGMDSLSLRRVRSVKVILPVFRPGAGDHIAPMVEVYFNDILQHLGAPALKIYSH